VAVKARSPLADYWAERRRKVKPPLDNYTLRLLARQDARCPTEDGRRAPALRFGDPRVQALAGALCTSVLAVTGITNKSLRALMTGLLGGANYTMNQASYDLARLRTNGLIDRIPGKNRYRLTDDGLRFAIFYTKLYDRLLRPLLAADQPPAPPPIRKALRTIDIHITETIHHARLLPKAA
jgi:predicted transcriptional regulator